MEIGDQIEEHFKNQKENNDQAQLCLSMGIPIYYVEDNTPENYLIKKYPNGKKQLINWIDRNTQEIINDNY